MANEKFPRYYNANSFGLTSDTEVKNGKWTEIGELQVPAQQEIAWGIGQVTKGGADTRKNVKIRLDSASGQINGTYRLAIANANKTDIRIVMEDRSENLVDGVELGETEIRAKEDSYLLIFFDPDSDTTIVHDDADNIFLAPAVVYQ